MPIEFLKIVVREMLKHPEILFVVSTICSAILNFLLQTSGAASEVLYQQPDPPVWKTEERVAGGRKVTYYPRGSLDTVESSFTRHELVFVMFYAPWCARSLEAKSQFHMLPQLFTDHQVKFVAINCWWKHGQCRKSKRAAFFPQFVAYRASLPEYQYFGPTTGEHMASFLLHLLQPIERVTSASELFMKSAHMPTVVGWFNMSDASAAANLFQYWAAAARFRARSPSNHIQFLVHTEPDLLVLCEGSHVIYMPLPYGKTLIMSKKDNMSATDIVQWVWKYKYMVEGVRWLRPLGVKSYQLADAVEQKPTFILLSPDNPLMPQHAEMKLRELHHDFMNCGNYSTSTTIRLGILSRIRDAKEVLNLYQDCLELHEDTTAHRTLPLPPEPPPCPHRGAGGFKCCHSVAGRVCEGGEVRCELCAQSSQASRRQHLCTELSSGPALSSLSPLHLAHSCHQGYNHYNVSARLSLCCYDASRRRRRTRDAYVWSAERARLLQRCRVATFTAKQGYPLFLTQSASLDDEFDAENYEDNTLTGLNCRTNETLSFLLMDSRYAQDFARRLGLNVGPFESGALILDAENEQVFVHRGDINKKELREFILQYSSGLLRPTLMSETVPFATPVHQQRGTSQLLEVTADSFDRVVLDNAKDVVLLHYSRWCAFCTAAMHVLHAAARYFRRADTLIFAKISHDENDVSWSHKVGSLPTVQLFPAHSKAYSVTYPSTKALTLPDLFSFILLHSSLEVKLRSVVSLCDAPCVARNLDAAQRQLAVLKNEIAALRAQHSAGSELIFKRFSDRLAVYRDLLLEGRCRLMCCLANRTSSKKLYALQRYLPRLVLKIERKRLQYGLTEHLIHDIKEKGIGEYTPVDLAHLTVKLIRAQTSH